MGNRHKFDEHRCRQTIWAVYEEGVRYFSQRLSPDDFAMATTQNPVRFPTTLLAHAVGEMTIGKPLQRLSFPKQWTSSHYNKAKPAAGPPTNKPGGGFGTMSRGGNGGGFGNSGGFASFGNNSTFGNGGGFSIGNSFGNSKVASLGGNSGNRSAYPNVGYGGNQAYGVGKEGGMGATAGNNLNHIHPTIRTMMAAHH